MGMGEKLFFIDDKDYWVIKDTFKVIKSLVLFLYKWRDELLSLF